MRSLLMRTTILASKRRLSHHHHFWFSSSLVSSSPRCNPLLASSSIWASALSRSSAGRNTTIVAFRSLTSYRYSPSSSSKKKTKVPSNPTPAGTSAPSIQIRARPEGEEEVVASASADAPVDPEREREMGQLQSQLHLAYQQGQYAQALSLAQTLLQQTQEHYGGGVSDGGATSPKPSRKSSRTKDSPRSHPAVASAHAQVALLMYKHAGDFEASRHHYQQALRIYQDTVGPDHASTALVYHNWGTMIRQQIHVDPTLAMSDRWTLLETAAQYLQQAYQIRQVECGLHHPHTVASRSSLGATLAARILFPYQFLPQSPSSSSSSSSSSSPAALAAMHPSHRWLSAIISSSSSSSSSASPPLPMTAEAWQWAEDHLRQALHTSVTHPRGTSLPPASSPSTAQALRPPPSAPAPASSAPTAMAEIQTLSAAAAAQNLAIFLKTRATMIPTPSWTPPSTDQDPTSASSSLESSSSSSSPPVSPESGASFPLNREDWLQEALHLYQQVLQVRSQLLPQFHPDRVATQYSLAELLEVLGQLEEANRLRQEILDTYDPPTTTPDESHPSPSSSP